MKNIWHYRPYSAMFLNTSMVHTCSLFKLPWKIAGTTGRIQLFRNTFMSFLLFYVRLSGFIKAQLILWWNFRSNLVRCLYACTVYFSQTAVVTWLWASRDHVVVVRFVKCVSLDSIAVYWGTKFANFWVGYTFCYTSFLQTFCSDNFVRITSV